MDKHPDVYFVENGAIIVWNRRDSLIKRSSCLMLILALAVCSRGSGFGREVYAATSPAKIETGQVNQSASLNSLPPEPEPETEILESLAVPTGDTGFKAYMDWKAITNKKSPQYRLQQQAVTDANGFRRLADDYMVAMGTYYARSCGERFRIELDSGAVFTVIISDIKSDRHTDASHRYTQAGGGRKNVIEFIVDQKSIPKACRQAGDMSAAGLEGNILSISRISEEKN